MRNLGLHVCSGMRIFWKRCSGTSDNWDDRREVANVCGTVGKYCKVLDSLREVREMGGEEFIMHYHRD